MTGKEKMNKIRESIDEEKEHLLQIRKRAAAILGRSPEGTLHIRRKTGRVELYRTLIDQRTGEHTEQYLSGQDGLLPCYIKKYCAARTMKIVEEGLKVLEKDPYRYDPDVLQDEYRKFEELFGKNTPNQFITKQTILKRWQEGPYRKSQMPVPENIGRVTERGELVRSKNEELCANCLNRLGIPYHYEEMFWFSDGTQAAPDFTVKSPKDSELYWMEILGMMSDPGYLENNARKLEKYAKNGLIPGERLLLFYEFSDQSFDTRLFEETVRKKFLE